MKKNKSTYVNTVFCKRLRMLRKEILNMKQSEFAKYTGLSQPTISAYEQGRTNPTVDKVILIAEKCNISIDWLCGRNMSGSVNSMGDLVEILLALYCAKEFAFETAINERNTEDEVSSKEYDSRDWIRLTFFPDSMESHPEQIYSELIF